MINAYRGEVLLEINECSISLRPTLQRLACAEAILGEGASKWENLPKEKQVELLSCFLDKAYDESVLQKAVEMQWDALHAFFIRYQEAMPWQKMMEVGFSVLGLSSDTFWNMTLAEYCAAICGHTQLYEDGDEAPLDTEIVSDLRDLLQKNTAC
jgi:uncharacterized phage protein (TIGR02216 family)